MNTVAWGIAPMRGAWGGQAALVGLARPRVGCVVRGATAAGAFWWALFEGEERVLRVWEAAGNSSVPSSLGVIKRREVGGKGRRKGGKETYHMTDMASSTSCTNPRSREQENPPVPPPLRAYTTGSIGIHPRTAHIWNIASWSSGQSC